MKRLYVLILFILSHFPAHTQKIKGEISAGTDYYFLSDTALIQFRYPAIQFFTSGRIRTDVGGLPFEAGWHVSNLPPNVNKNLLYPSMFYVHYDAALFRKNLSQRYKNYLLEKYSHTGNRINKYDIDKMTSDMGMIEEMLQPEKEEYLMLKSKFAQLPMGESDQWPDSVRSHWERLQTLENLFKDLENQKQQLSEQLSEWKKQDSISRDINRKMYESSTTDMAKELGIGGLQGFFSGINQLQAGRFLWQRDPFVSNGTWVDGLSVGYGDNNWKFDVMGGRSFSYSHYNLNNPVIKDPRNILGVGGGRRFGNFFANIHFYKAFKNGISDHRINQVGIEKNSGKWQFQWNVYQSIGSSYQKPSTIYHLDDGTVFYDTLQKVEWGQMPFLKPQTIKNNYGYASQWKSFFRQGRHSVKLTADYVSNNYESFTFLMLRRDMIQTSIDYNIVLKQGLTLGVRERQLQDNLSGLPGVKNQWADHVCTISWQPTQNLRGDIQTGFHQRTGYERFSIVQNWHYRITRGFFTGFTLTHQLFYNKNAPINFTGLSAGHLIKQKIQANLMIEWFHNPYADNITVGYSVKIRQRNIDLFVAPVWRSDITTSRWHQWNVRAMAEKYLAKNLKMGLTMAGGQYLVKIAEQWYAHQNLWQGRLQITYIW